MGTTLRVTSELRTQIRQDPHTQSNWPVLLCLTTVAMLFGGVMLQNGVAEATPTMWSVTPGPTHGRIHGNLLADVSCASRTFCMAVGSHKSETLAESWNGTAWSIDPSPNPTGVSGSSLSGVSCISSIDCTAVGGSGNASTNEPLIESWDGTSWSIVPSPIPGTGPANGLASVSCTSPSFCMAAGIYNPPSGGTGTLIESWNGTAWSVVPSPNHRTGDNSLNGVSCLSPTSCIAVGSYDKNETQYVATLVESWNGSLWSIVPSPNPYANQFEVAGDNLSGVSCISSTFCVAVGVAYAAGGPGGELTAVLAWNGTTWSIVPSPDPSIDMNPSPVNELTGVSCTSSTDCVAVGYDLNGPGDDELTLIESWNGSVWKVTPSPNNEASDSLSKVSCVSSTRCTAVGGTLIETGR